MFPNVPPPPVKLFDPAFTAPLTVNDPDTDKSSSTVVVPPAESITKLPVLVSISLFAVIPSLILSNLAPSLPVTCPDMTAVPETVRLSVISTVPPAESNIKLPDDVSISLAAVIPILTLSMVAPVAVRPAIL